MDEASSGGTPILKKISKKILTTTSAAAKGSIKLSKNLALKTKNKVATLLKKRQTTPKLINPPINSPKGSSINSPKEEQISTTKEDKLQPTTKEVKKKPASKLKKFQKKIEIIKKREALKQAQHEEEDQENLDEFEPLANNKKTEKKKKSKKTMVELKEQPQQQYEDEGSWTIFDEPGKKQQENSFPQEVSYPQHKYNTRNKTKQTQQQQQQQDEDEDKNKEEIKKPDHVEIQIPETKKKITTRQNKIDDLNPNYAEVLAVETKLWKKINNAEAFKVISKTFSESAADIAQTIITAPNKKVNKVKDEFVNDFCNKILPGLNIDKSGKKAVLLWYLNALIEKYKYNLQRQLQK